MCIDSSTVLTRSQYPSSTNFNTNSRIRPVVLPRLPRGPRCKPFVQVHITPPQAGQDEQSLYYRWLGFCHSCPACHFHLIWKKVKDKAWLVYEVPAEQWNGLPQRLRNSYRGTEGEWHWIRGADSYLLLLSQDIGKTYGQFLGIIADQALADIVGRYCESEVEGRKMESRRKYTPRLTGRRIGPEPGQLDPESEPESGQIDSEHQIEANTIDRSTSVISEANLIPIAPVAPGPPDPGPPPLQNPGFNSETETPSWGPPCNLDGLISFNVPASDLEPHKFEKNLKQLGCAPSVKLAGGWWCCRLTFIALKWLAWLRQRTNGRKIEDENRETWPLSRPLALPLPC